MFPIIPSASGYHSAIGMSPIADPGVVSLIPFCIFNCHSLLNQEAGAVVSYKRKYVHKLLVNHLVKLAQEKVWLG